MDKVFHHRSKGHGFIYVKQDVANLKTTVPMLCLAQSMHVSCLRGLMNIVACFSWPSGVDEWQLLNAYFKVKTTPFTCHLLYQLFFTLWVMVLNKVGFENSRALCEKIKWEIKYYLRWLMQWFGTKVVTWESLSSPKMRVCVCINWRS